MNIIKTNIPDLVVIEPQVWGDDRGYFFETYKKDNFDAHGLPTTWVQDNEAYSEKGVLRGLHYQLPPVAQAKLVRVAYGEVLDVVVDIREGSATYGKSFSIILSGTNKKQLLVPRGFAHGYVVLSDTALFLYKVDNPYSKENERGISYNDPALAIDWILDEKDLITSNKDKAQVAFGQHDKYVQ